MGVFIECAAFGIGATVMIFGGLIVCYVLTEWMTERLVRLWKLWHLIADYAWNRKEYKAWKAAKNEAAELWSKS